MILPDVNLLVYAYNQDLPHHRAARQWWEKALSDNQPVALVWEVICGFIRLTTHRKIFTSPLPPDRACKIIEEWLDCSNVQIVDPGPRHLTILSDLLSSLKVAGNLVTDTHLAAIAIEHGFQLHSNDADFGRFKGLRWINPLR